MNIATEENITHLFEELEAVFKRLAAAEDRCRALQDEIDSLREGSPVRAQKLVELKEADTERIAIAREYALCSMRIDRVRLLLQLKKCGPCGGK